MVGPMLRLYFFVILSVLIHLLFFTGLVYFPAPELAKNIEVVLLERPQNQAQTQQIVRQAEPPPNLKQPTDSKPTPLFSEKTQRVKQQTRAALFGLTKNRYLEPQKRTSDPKPLPGGELPTPQQNSQSGSSKTWIPSTIGERLPDDIKVGNITALNTDRHLYYSFYSRIEEAIRWRWENKVTFTIQRTPPAKFGGTNSIWISNIEIILNPKGELIKAALHKSSGICGFDDAAIQSFIEAKYFPHPPTGMIGEDGLIRIRYGFEVNYRPRIFAGP